MTKSITARTPGLLTIATLLVAALAAAGAAQDGVLPPEDRATLQAHADIVSSTGFQALRDVLAGHPGFVALFPADGVLHAAFSGDAPAPSPLWPVPAGWSLQLHAGAAAMQMSHHLPDLNLTDLAKPANHGVPPNPLDFHGIRPGSLILTSFQGVSGTFICTIAFIMEDQDTGRYYAATAGHCLLPAGTRATHGPGADWDPAKTAVIVCVDNCQFGGQLSFFNSDLRFLGSVKYARQVSNTPFLPGDIGNDFGLVEILPIWYSPLFNDVNPRMAMWDGPVGVNSLEGTGNPLVHYGNGIDGGSFVATKGRAGVSINDGHPWTWQAAAEVNGGDSGSPFSHAELVTGLDVVQGQDALGVLTHGIGVAGVGIPGLAWGTSLGRGVMMAFDDAGVGTALVPAGTILNQPPTASFTASCTGLACAFDGTASSDPDGTVASHAWDFGDGSTATGATVNHTFGASGTYTVRLTVRDDDGALSDPATRSVTVTGSAPTANFTFSCTGLACAFDGSGSSDPDGAVASHAWDFGDGNTATGATANHTYAASGTYNVSLTVTDDAGGTDTQSQNVTVSGGSNITLTATGHKVKGVQQTDLSWSGAASADVDVYRDGVLVATTANDGAHTDDTGAKGSASYVYHVCEAGTTACSNEASVAF